MDKLIKLSDAIKAIQSLEVILGKTGVQVATDGLERLPEGVVKCWACKHRDSIDCHMCHEEYDEDDGGDCYLVDRAVDPNGFCCYGEGWGE